MRRFFLLALLLLGACTGAQASAPLSQPTGEFHYLAQWEWVQEVCDERTGECEVRPGVEGDQDTSYWRCPEGSCAGLIDLRTLPQMSRAGGTPEGYGWFVYEEPVDICPLLCDTEGVLVADGLDTPADLTTVTNLATRLELRIDAQTPRQILTELLQLRGDPLGETAHKPLLSSEIFLAGERIASFTPWHEPDADPAWRDLALRTKQEDYRKIREHSLDRGDEHYKRVLDRMAEDYRLPPETFVPDDLEFEGTLPHRTMIADTLNRADNTDLNASDSGKTLDGSAATWTWTETRGTALEILNNQLVTQANQFVEARADQALSSTNHFSQAVMEEETPSVDFGVMVRVDTGATPNHYLWQSDGADNVWRFFKLVGSFSQVGADQGTDYTAPDGDTYRLEVSESNLEGFENGISRHTATDMSLTAELRTGVRATNDATFDNFEAADLEEVVAAPETRVYLNITEQLSPTPTADEVERWLLAGEAVAR